jgi:hypothetical protein
LRYKLPLVVLAVAAVALSNIGPVLGQTADPTLAKLPPDDLTDPAVHLRAVSAVGERQRGSAVG